MGAFVSHKQVFQGPAKLMHKKYGAQAVKFLLTWHAKFGFPKNGSLSQFELRSLRKKMAKEFEAKIEKRKISSCSKINDNWAKNLNVLKLWEGEADSRKRVETMKASIKAFASLSVDEAHEKISMVTPRGLVDEITRTSYFSTPFCDHVTDFDPT